MGSRVEFRSFIGVDEGGGSDGHDCLICFEGDEEREGVSVFSF